MKKIIIKFDTAKVYESLYSAIGELAKKIDIQNLITLIFNYTGTESIDEVVFGEIERVDPSSNLDFSTDNLDVAILLLELLSVDVYNAACHYIRNENYTILIKDWISKDTAMLELLDERDY